MLPLPGSFKRGRAGVNRVARAGLPRRDGVLIRAAMADERTIEAIGRIERALARIEALAEQAQQEPHAPPEAPRDNNELLQLREAHQALRGKVEGAISQIDRLLAAEERV